MDVSTAIRLFDTRCGIALSASPDWVWPSQQLPLIAAVPSNLPFSATCKGESCLV